MFFENAARFHFAQFKREIFAKALLRVRQADPHHWAFRQRALLESASWLCLGVDCGYFTDSDALDLLNTHREFLSPPGSNHLSELVSHDDWSGLLLAGDFREALSRGPLGGSPVGGAEGVFQSALYGSWCSAAPAQVEALQEMLLFADNSRWDQELEAARRFLLPNPWNLPSSDATIRVTGGESGQILSPDGTEEKYNLEKTLRGGSLWLVSALLELFQHIQSLEQWRNTVARIELPSNSRDPIRLRLLLRALPQLATRVQFWRLDRTRSHVARRVAEIVDVCDKTMTSVLFHSVLPEGNVAIVPLDPWSGQSLRFLIDKAFQDWDSQSLRSLSA